MSHRKARLTPAGRLLPCRRIEEGAPIAHVAAGMGISRLSTRLKIGPPSPLRIDPPPRDLVTQRRRQAPSRGLGSSAGSVALEIDDGGVVDESVDHGPGDCGIAEDLAPRPKALFEVTITEARS